MTDTPAYPGDLTASCGAAPAQTGFNAGDQIAGRYRLLRLLGRGGHGEVWQGEDRLGDERVALKLFRRGVQLDLARVRREILALRILRLPGVVRLLDEVVEGGCPFLVMELVEGSPFPGEVRRGSWPAIAEVTVALLETLVRIHAAGIVHRDLKPENVLVNAEGRPTVLDFGISSGERLGQRLTEEGMIIGTPAYLAPEQILGGPVTAQTDLYAVGLILYEALAGRLPQEQRDARALLRARIAERAPPLKAVAPAVPHAVAGLIDLLLSRDPGDRPRSAAEVLSILRGHPTPELRGPMLPRLGGAEPVERLLAAACGGRSVDLVGPRHTGRTRCLQELAEALESEGRRVAWAVPGKRAFASLEPVLGAPGERARSLPEVVASIDGRLRAELAAGLVLLVDDAERLDLWSAAAIERSRTGGAVIRALLEQGPPSGEAALPPVELAPLTIDALEPLFSGPERVFHLRSDAARMLFMRTEGVQARVAEEVTAWLRAGIARWDGGTIAVDRDALDRLEAGARVLLLDRYGSVEAASGEALPPHLEELAAWIAVASPVAHPGLIAAAMGLAQWQLEADLEELSQRSLIRRLPDGRLEVKATLQAEQGWSDERRRLAHQALARALPAGAEGRLLHLIGGAGSDGAAGAEALEIGAEAEVLARRLSRDGRLGQAIAALEQGLLVVRRSSAPQEDRTALEERLLSRWVEVALIEYTPQAHARALYELCRSEQRTEVIEHLEELIRAAVAFGAGGDRALVMLDAIPPSADPDLERQRQGLRVLAARRCSQEREEAVLGEVESWASWAQDATTRARLAGWLGRLRYRQGRFEEAARLHAEAAEQEPWVTARIAARLNGASALMEAFRLRDASAWAEEARQQARDCRHAFYEARAEWILRSTAYRLDTAAGPDLELVDAVARLGVNDLEASVYFTEAAVAYRAGEHRIAVELAGRAQAVWNAIHDTSPALLVRCLALAAGAPLQGANEIDALAERALRCEVPGIGIQALGLLARSGAAVREAWAGAVHRLTQGIPEERWRARMDVLSVSEALQSLGVAREEPLRQRRHPRRGSGSARRQLR